MFNLFNRANFGNPTLIAFAGAAANEAPLASFGRIRSTVTSARQMQLGARMSRSSRMVSLTLRGVICTGILPTAHAALTLAVAVTVAVSSTRSAASTDWTQ